MMNAKALWESLMAIDRWLEGMRGPEGYTGPIAHWWESNFMYAGPLFDWRYEGIVDGYRTLYLVTGESAFRDRAVRAANDLVAAQLPDGRFKNSSFQFGPNPGGTPHEAAVDAALFSMAALAQTENRASEAQPWLEAACKNIEAYWIGTLWHGQGFWDQPDHPVLVANKHGTVIEALLGYQDFTGVDCAQYLEAGMAVIMGLQVRAGPQCGGTIHAGIGPSRLAVPIYTARAMNGLLRLYEYQRLRAIEQAVRDAAFFLTQSLSEAGIWWGMYPDGRLASSPTMIAAAGDLLRFFILASQAGILDGQRQVEVLLRLLINHQTPSGAIPTARGFSHKGQTLDTHGGRDLRDVVPVVGWVDKAFRGLALLVGLESGLTWGPFEKSSASAAHRVPVTWRGKPYLFVEDSRHMRLEQYGTVRYRWEKGCTYPHVCQIF
jgi:hypothetical protein